MPSKFRRNYRLEIEDTAGNIQTIAFPLTCDFNIERNTMAQANSANFTVFNLSQTVRNLIFKSSITFKARTINFYAGYGDNLPLVFSGILSTCLSFRESTDWITTISAKDPGIPIASNCQVSLAAGSSRASNVQNLVNDFMPGIKFGQIGSLFDDHPTLVRGNSYNGPVLSVLKQMTSGNFYIDNGIAYVLKPNECLNDGGYTTIDSSTGLLGSPSYDGVCVNCKVMFEPRIVMSQQITLDSEEEFFNGTFKVVAYSHEGRISGASAGEATTTISLYNPRDSTGLQILSVQ